MKVTTKGQVTIPQEIRNRLGIYPGTDVEFSIDGDNVRITPDKKAATRGEAIVARMRGQGTVQMTTDEILALMRDAS
jgi:AbrB family looped-hinge helix DNA binding protein